MTNEHYNDILNLLQEGTQCYNVWKHMHDHDVIDPRTAYMGYGILALHSRISDLRRLGADIHKEMVSKNGHTYGVYSIESQPQRCDLSDDVECNYRDGRCHIGECAYTRREEE